MKISVCMKKHSNLHLPCQTKSETDTLLRRRDGLHNNAVISQEGVPGYFLNLLGWKNTKRFLNLI